MSQRPYWSCAASLRASVRPGLVGALLVLALGAGCNTPPPYTPPSLPAFLREDVALDVPARPPAQVRAESRQTGACETDPALPPPPPAAAQPWLQQPSSVTLPEAIQETIFANLRIKSGAEKVQQARADLVTASLLPNPTLWLDSQLNPLPGARPFTRTMQGGPPQEDVLVNFPIDWFVFGKRLAALEATRLGVDVAAAEFADLVRLKVSDTVVTFYDLLEAKALLDLQREDLTDLRRIEEVVKKQVEAGGVGKIELDRLRLAVLDSQRELRRRELAVSTTRAKLRPMLGRKTVEAGFDIQGELGIAATAEPLALPQAMTLAEKNRPDLVALSRGIAKAEADLVSERRKAWPVVHIQPWYTYQFQKMSIGFPDARSWGGAMTTTLPFTDRNQGNIEKALSARYEAMKNLHAQLAEVRSEVEQAVDTYQMALTVITSDDPTTLETARRVRDATVAAYKAGGKRLLDVIDAQRTYRDRVRLSINNRAEYWRALYRLNAAVGGRALCAEPSAGGNPELIPTPPTPAPRGPMRDKGVDLAPPGAQAGELPAAVLGPAREAPAALDDLSLRGRRTGAQR